MLGIGIPVSPSATTGDGSWVWLVAGVVLVLAVLATTWFGRLWGRAARPQTPNTDARRSSNVGTLRHAA